MIQFTERFILIDFQFVFDIIKCIKKEDKSEFERDYANGDFRIW